MSGLKVRSRSGFLEVELDEMGRGKVSLDGKAIENDVFEIRIHAGVGEVTKAWLGIAVREVNVKVPADVVLKEHQR